LSFIDNLKKFFTTTEQDVVLLLVEIKTGAAVAAHEIAAGLAWVEQHTADITTGIQQVTTLVTGIAAVTPSLKNNATIQKAVTEANAAVAALNAYASAAQSGDQAQALVNGYVAFQQANSAVSTARAVAAGS
jgi:hypothetical protein